MQDSQDAEILVLGDLHGQFDEEDRRFIEKRSAALTVFVGDFGDENPEICAELATLEVPKLAILGNHDAWQSFRSKKASDALRESMKHIAAFDIAYATRKIPGIDLSFVGARPFSWGGPSLRSPELYGELFGVHSIDESAERIIELARETGSSQVAIIAHNGPKGLGKTPGSIFGKDFGRPGGDWGDQDLKLAIQGIRQLGIEVPLVICGHMHHRLNFPRGAERERCVQKDGTIIANTARVPRIFEDDDGAGLVRNYTSIRLRGSEVLSIRELDVSQGGTRARRYYQHQNAESPRRQGADRTEAES